MCDFFYKTKLITKLGSFWSEIRNEIWSISNEIQAKTAVQYPSPTIPRKCTWATSRTINQK